MNKKVDEEITISLPTGVKEYAVTGLTTLHELMASLETED
jgi:hypothetical protein